MRRAICTEVSDHESSVNPPKISYSCSEAARGAAGTHAHRAVRRDRDVRLSRYVSIRAPLRQLEHYGAALGGPRFRQDRTRLRLLDARGGRQRNSQRGTSSWTPGAPSLLHAPAPSSECLGVRVLCLCRVNMPAATVVFEY